MKKIIVFILLILTSILIAQENKFKLKFKNCEQLNNWFIKKGMATDRPYDKGFSLIRLMGGRDSGMFYLKEKNYFCIIYFDENKFKSFEKKYMETSIRFNIKVMAMTRQKAAQMMQGIKFKQFYNAKCASKYLMPM